jgi:hypothetical protein
MTPFFPPTNARKTVTHGKLSFELPILYFRDDAFGLFFTADPNKVRSVMPSHRLHPVRLSAKKAIVGVVAFNYMDTTLGPYGELAVVLPQSLFPPSWNPSIQTLAIWSCIFL